MPRPGTGPRRTPPQASRSSAVPGRGKAPPPPTGGGPVPAAPVPRGQPRQQEASRIFLCGAYTFGVLLGAVLGLYGVIAVPAGPRPGGTLLSLGLLIALAGNAAAALLVQWLTGTRLGAMVVLVGWIPVVLLLGSSRPEGDLLLQATNTGYLFLAVGSLTPAAVAVFGPARRGLTALPPPR